MLQSTQKCANKRRGIVAASNLSMMNEKMAVNAEMLNSWKEVAVYLGRGVRTVQRWELDLGLPVRRPRGKSRSAVIALKPELDHWLTCTSKETSIHKTPEISINKSLNEANIIQPLVKLPQAEALHSNTELLVSKTKLLLARSHDLCTQSRSLCEQMNRALVVTAGLAKKKRRQRAGIVMEHAKAATTIS